MPICAKCEHAGSDHNWISPKCSRCSSGALRCPWCFEKYKQRRKRGQCRYPFCKCAAYRPLTNKPAPLNSYIGRALYRNKNKNKKDARH